MLVEYGTAHGLIHTEQDRDVMIYPSTHILCRTQLQHTVRTRWWTLGSYLHIQGLFWPAADFLESRIRLHLDQATTPKIVKTVSKTVETTKLRICEEFTEYLFVPEDASEETGVKRFELKIAYDLQWLDSHPSNDYQYFTGGGQ